MRPYISYINLQVEREKQPTAKILPTFIYFFLPGTCAGTGAQYRVRGLVSERQGDEILVREERKRLEVGGYTRRGS